MVSMRKFGLDGDKMESANEVEKLAFPSHGILSVVMIFRLFAYDYHH